MVHVDTAVVPRKILLAEDGRETRAVVKQILVSEGFEVNAVGTGADAVHALAQGAFQAAILDVGLPDLSGLEVLRRLRSNGVKIPVIVISGREDHALTAQEHDAQGYLVKPFTLETLRVHIERWVT